MHAHLGDLNWLAVVAAAVSSFIVGGLWYGPLFGKVWMQASGNTEEKAAGANMAKVFGLSFVLQLVAATVLALFIGGEGLHFALLASLHVGLFWVATALGVVYLFEQRSLGHWAVNAGYQVVAFLVMGIVLGLWK